MLSAPKALGKPEPRSKRAFKCSTRHQQNPREGAFSRITFLGRRLIDGATAHGKIRVYRQKGSPLPEGWAFDAKGQPTTDATQALSGLIQPIGQHKGLLSDAAYGTELGNMVEGPRPGLDGHFFAAIDIAAFQDVESFKNRVDAVIDEVHESRPRAGVSRLFVPGEIEAEFESTYAHDGILLARTTVNDVAAAADALEVDPSNLFLIG